MVRPTAFAPVRSAVPSPIVPSPTFLVLPEVFDVVRVFAPQEHIQVLVHRGVDDRVGDAVGSLKRGLRGNPACHGGNERALSLIDRQEKIRPQEDVKVFIGGIIPDEDIPRLKELGISGVYGPGASTETIVKEVTAAVQRARA